MPKFIISLFFSIPVITVLIFINAAFIQGDPGFKVDRTQKGLLISKVYSPVNPVRESDLVVSANGLSHHEILGHLILGRPVENLGTFTVLREDRRLTFPLNTVPHSLFSILGLIWPQLMLIIVFIVLGGMVVCTTPPNRLSRLLCLMLCSFATALSATIPSTIAFFSPTVYSFAFLVHTPFNWIAFGLWLHFALRFPEERDLVRDRWWIPALIYLIPALTTIGGALYTAGFSPEAFGWIQRLRNLYLPVIIIAVFVKHASDYKKLKTQQERNRIKLPLIAYWLSFSPYLLFYLLPNIVLDAPLISFRMAVFGFFILPLAYYASIIRYKLFKVDQIISKTIAYSAIILALTVVYSLFFSASQRWFFGEGALPRDVFLIFLIVMNMIFHPVIMGLDHLIRQLFFRSDAISIKVMHEFSRRISSTLDLTRIIRAVTQELPPAIHVNAVAVMSLEEKRSRLFPEDLRFGSSPWPQSRVVARMKEDKISHFNVLQVIRDPELEREFREIEAAGFNLILPLRASRTLSGLLFIGPKTGGGLFGEAEILLLGSFANQAAIALENAIRHQSLVAGKQQLEQMFDQKVQAEKMAAIGEMTSILAHELKNPLGIIHSSAQYLANGARSRRVTQEMLDYILKEVDHLNLSINSILNLARQKPPEFSRTDLERDIGQLMELWQQSQDHCRAVDIRIEAAAALPPVYADFRQLAQVLLNLVRNSEEMMPDGGRIRIRLEPAGEDVLIRILDDGPGIPDDIRDQVFDNFFTTKKQGLGLGLTACRQIIQAHQGSISLENRSAPGQSGAEARIRLPVRPLADMGMAGGNIIAGMKRNMIRSGT